MTQNERRSIPIWKRIIIFIVTLVFFTLQITLFVVMFQLNFSGQINVVIYLLLELYALVIVLHIIHKPMSASYKMTWSILILLLPLPCSLLYWLNHRSRKLPKRKQMKINSALSAYHGDNRVIEELDEIDSKAAKHAKVVLSDTGYPAYKNTKYTFLEDGFVKFEDLIKELNRAEKYILIEMFIISDGFLLDEIMPILMRKGQDGVEIKIIYDDLGSKATLKNRTIKKFTNIPNCQIVNYNPLGLNINPAFNYRDHRKIIVIDGRVAYCGGDNLADEYIHKKERFGFWRDNCGKYEGEAVASFIAMFIETWYMSTKEILNIHSYLTDYKVYDTKGYVVPFGDGPSESKNTGYDTFLSLITSAEKTLYISTPYFVIDDTMLQNIALAARSGVDVRILMPGIPDKKLAFYLARYHYRDILKAGGKIYEFSKGFNHAKNIMVDGKYGFIGTINVDYRSMFLHYECGALILLNDEIKRMEDDFLKACEESKPFTYKDWKNRSWWQKLISYLAYLFSPMF